MPPGKHNFYGSQRGMFTILLIIQVCKVVFGNFECIGTCYSGDMRPRPKDIYDGKYLEGFSYKNITTTDAAICYQSCVRDCRCKACQIQGNRCELLDADSDFCGKTLSAGKDYIYYNLVQSQYTRKSHMIPDNICYNGCCKSNPCQNGGTCNELCQNPKQKFSCRCTKFFKGRVCEQKAASCMDLLVNSHGEIPINGNYTIHRSDNGSPIQVYCDFNSTNQVWTLIESFELSVQLDFRAQAFSQDFPRNADSPLTWNNYRMYLSDMQFIREKSTLFRSTCEFQNRIGLGPLTPDYLLGSLDSIDIISNVIVTGKCIEYKYMNIRGKEFFNQKGLTFSKNDVYHVHLEPNVGCGLLIPNYLPEEEIFGYYKPPNSAFSCTATPTSTTQWWLGEEIRSNDDKC